MKRNLDWKTLVTGAIGFVLTAVLAIFVNAITGGTIIEWMGGLTKHNLAFAADRVGSKGPLRTGDPENLFTERKTAPNSEDFAFCTLSHIQIIKPNQPDGQCRLERETSGAWEVIPSNAACQLTCFKPVVAR